MCRGTTTNIMHDGRKTWHTGGGPPWVTGKGWTEWKPKYQLGRLLNKLCGNSSNGSGPGRTGFDIYTRNALPARKANPGRITGRWMVVIKWRLNPNNHGTNCPYRKLGQILGMAT